MAIVRLSERLSQNILGSVLKAFNEREKDLAAKIPHCFDADETFNLFVSKEVRESAALLPESLYLKSTNFYVRFNALTYELTMTQRQLIPDEWRNRYSTKLPRITADCPGYKEATDIVNQIAVIGKERAAVQSNIKQLLDKNATLQQLLKIWPNATAHVPEDVMARFNKQVSKEQKKKDTEQTAAEMAALLDGIAVPLAKATLLKQTS